MVLLLPKHVKITNFRLNVTFYLCYFGVLAFCIGNFIASRGGTRQVPNAPQVAVSFSMFTFAQIKGYDRRKDPVCSFPAGWSDRDVPSWQLPPIGHVYERFHCTFLNTNGSDCAENPDCLDVFETGSPKSPFELDLFVKEQHIYVGQNVSLSGLSSKLSQTDAALDTKFHVFAQAYVYKFSYKYANLMGMGTQRDAKTVFLDATGMPALTFEAGKDIEINVPQALQLAQGPRVPTNGFISQRERLGDFAGDNERFPAWIFETGAMFHVVANCYSDDYDIKATAGEAAGDASNSAWDLDASSERPVCVMHLTLVASEAFDVALELKEPGKIKRMNRAIVRMVGKEGNSFFRAYDSNAVLLYLTSALVLLALPKKFIYWLTLNCLGHLSQIYKKVIVQDFGVRYACARAVLQSVSQSVCFFELADCRGPDGTMDAGVSQKQLKNRLKGVVKHRADRLDDREVEVLSDFAYRQILLAQERLRKPGDSRNQWGRFINFGDLGTLDVDLKDKNKKQEKDPRGVLDIDGFCQATGSEIIGLDALVKLFDADRFVWPGERFFTPRAFRRHVHQQSPSRRAMLSSASSTSVFGGGSAWSRSLATGAVSPTPTASAPEALTATASTPELSSSITRQIHGHGPELSSKLPHVRLFGATGSAAIECLFGPQPPQDVDEAHVECTQTRNRGCGVDYDTENVDGNVRTLGISVKRLELTVKELSVHVEALQAELKQEQNLRYASETGLREEMQRAMKVCSEQTALRTDLALASNSRGGSAACGGHEHQHQPSHQSEDNSRLQPRSAATSLDLARLRQDVLELNTQLEGRVETLACQTAERCLALRLESLETLLQRFKSKATSTPMILSTPQDHSSFSEMGNGRDIRIGKNGSAMKPLDCKSTSQNYECHVDQAAQILRLEESLEALRRRVEMRSDPTQSFASRLPECFHPSRRGVSANAGHATV